MKPTPHGAFRRLATLVLGSALVAVLAGCAHPISLNSNASTLLVGSGSGKLAKGAALAISDEDRKREVVGPGGGGDKVSYFPYRDLEVGLYLALSETFERVSRVAGPTDPKIQQERLDYVITPTIKTTSFSPSLFTWPPTIFTVELLCKVTDPEGRTVTEVRAFGEGRAEFDEFKSDFSLSAKRAADDALGKLVKALGEAKPKLP